MSLAVIILNWNNAPDTIRCVQAVEAWQRLEPVISVVDNGSSDDSVAQLKRDCPNVRLIVAERNLGFAAGNNLAVCRAMAAGATHVLLINNDASISETDVIQLMRTMERTPQAGIVGPLLRDPPPACQLQAAGGKNVAWHVNTHRRHQPESTEPFSVDYVPGTVILIDSQVFGQVGLLDEAYFLSGEIADLCWRARQRGFKCLIDPTAVAVHDAGRSSGLREAFYAYYFLRNRFLYVRKFYRLMKVPLLLYWSIIGLVSTIKALVTGRQARAHAFRLALRHGLAGVFGDQSEALLDTLADLQIR